jgi:AraC-like DNA-binding protein
MTSDRAPGIPLVASAGVAPFVRFLVSEGLQVTRWLRQAGVPQHELRRPDGVLPLVSCYRFLDTVVRDERLSRLPVLVSERVSPLELGRFGEAMRHAGTIGAYLQLGSRLATTQSNSGIEFRLHREGDLLRVSQWVAPAKGCGPAVVDVYTLALTLRFLQGALGAQWRPEVVELRAGSEQFFEGSGIRAADRVLTGRRQSSFTLPIHLLTHPTGMQPQKCLSFDDLEATALPTEFLGALERLVCGALNDGYTDIRGFAQIVGTSPRSLQRRLSQCGTDYRSVLNRCRTRRASEWLAYSDRSIASIAADLGYTDASNFARAYRRATGYAPSEWRGARGGNEDAGAQCAKSEAGLATPAVCRSMPA